MRERPKRLVYCTWMEKKMQSSSFAFIGPLLVKAGSAIVGSLFGSVKR